MENLNYHGCKFLSLYLMDYALGNISFQEVKALVTCCFDNREATDGTGYNFGSYRSLSS